MPVEPITLYLRPRNFFLQNAALDVEPAYSLAPSETVGRRVGNGNGVGSKDEEVVTNTNGNGVVNGNGNENGVMDSLSRLVVG